MRKNLLFCLVAVCMLFASNQTRAQGKSCEEATPFPGMVFIMTPAEYPNGAWYSKTVTEPTILMIGGIDANLIKVYKGCTEEVPALPGEAQYSIEADQPYTIKIITTGATGPLMPTLSFMPLSTTPEGATCLNPIQAELSRAVKAEANKTLWYKINMSFSGSITICQMTGVPPMPNSDEIISASSKSDCYAEGNELNPLKMIKLKGGENVVKLTTGALKANAEGKTEIMFMFPMSSPPAPTCANQAQRMPLLKQNAETSFTNDVYDNYWRFQAPEAGEYTIKNSAPEGTILKIGKLVESGTKYACNFDTDLPRTTVGSNNMGELLVTLNADDMYIIGSELYSKFPTPTPLPYVKIEKGNTTDIASQENASKELVITPNPANGKFTIKSYLLREGADINVYDMAGNAVYRAKTAPVNGEFNVQLNNVTTGTYLVLVIGKSKSASTKITIN